MSALNTLSDRVASVGGETGDMLGALAGLFRDIQTPLSLVEALEPVVALCTANPQFECHPDDLRVAIDVAVARAEDLVHFGGLSYLTVVEASALVMYSMPGRFYALLNEKLRDRDRQRLKSFVRYIWLLMGALSKCPEPNQLQVISYRIITSAYACDVCIACVGLSRREKRFVELLSEGKNRKLVWLFIVYIVT